MHGMFKLLTLVTRVEPVDEVILGAPGKVKENHYSGTITF